MSKIASIETLISEFESAEEKDRSRLLKQIAIPTEEFEKHAIWKKDGYTRVCLARTDAFEFILLCWDKNAETSIHDHNGQDCWVYQVKGEVEEKRYSEEEGKGLEEIRKMTLTSGKLTYMNDRMGYHKLKNNSPNSERALTLHIYASPIEQCMVLNEETQKFEKVQMTYDCVANEPISK